MANNNAVPGQTVLTPLDVIKGLLNGEIDLGARPMPADQEEVVEDWEGEGFAPVPDDLVQELAKGFSAERK